MQSLSGAARSLAASAAASARVISSAPVRRVSAAAVSQSSSAAALAHPFNALPERQTARSLQRMNVRSSDKVSVVLRVQLDNLGYKGEEVRVAPGYARNFLVPYGKAVYATDVNRTRFKVLLPPEEARAIAQQREVNMLRARVSAFKLRFTRATKDGLHLYGSVTAADVVEGLAGSVLRKLGIKEKNVKLAAQEQEAAAGAPVTEAAVPTSDMDAAGKEAAPAPAPVPAKAAAPSSGGGAIKSVGEHRISIEPRPGLWCDMTVVVESS